MPLVGIDCRFASRRAGLGTYTREIVRSLLSVDGPCSWVVFVHDDPQTNQWLASLPVGSWKSQTVAAPHYTISEHRELRRAMRDSGISLFFSPHFTVPFFCPVPFVATIHDLILHRFPGNASFLKRCMYRVLVWRTLRKASAVIAVSEYTASQIGAYYGPAMRKKVSVVYEGFSAEFHRSNDAETTSVLDRLGLVRGFLLYVGNAKQHKNLAMLLEAHRAVPEAPHLVIVSDDDLTHLTIDSRRVRIFGNVSDATLRCLYSAASCFVTASLEEGFCLPSLEARACGCPVIAFDLSALPEVAGPDAKLIAPDLPSLTEAIRHPPTSSSPPENIFSWASAGASTHAILQR
ncbi:glycosyltransferase family 4 protein, partial [Candidatus Peregrinibacteria bacterium]|nr:glycosyltransferase family 4 protein [Candidatus Peregrinibacteria bacterium]